MAVQFTGGYSMPQFANQQQQPQSLASGLAGLTAGNVQQLMPTTTGAIATFNPNSVGQRLGATPGWDTMNKWMGYTDDNGQQVTGAAQTGLSALSGLMNMWNSYSANKLAQDQFAFQKDAFNKNLEASTKSYNNSLTNQANRMAARGDAATSGMTADQYVSKYGLKG